MAVLPHLDVSEAQKQQLAELWRQWRAVRARLAIHLQHALEPLEVLLPSLTCALRVGVLIAATQAEWLPAGWTHPPDGDHRGGSTHLSLRSTSRRYPPHVRQVLPPNLPAAPDTAASTAPPPPQWPPESGWPDAAASHPPGARFAAGTTLGVHSDAAGRADRSTRAVGPSGGTTLPQYGVLNADRGPELGDRCGGCGRGCGAPCEACSAAVAAACSGIGAGEAVQRACRRLRALQSQDAAIIADTVGALALPGRLLTPEQQRAACLLPWHGGIAGSAGCGSTPAVDWLRVAQIAAGTERNRELLLPFLNDAACML